MNNILTNNPPEIIIDRLTKLLANQQYLALAEAAKKVIDRYPESTLVWNLLGMAKRQNGEFEGAIAAFKTALRFKPDFFDALNNLGNAFRDLRNISSAKEAYEKALSLQPRSHEVMINLAVAHHADDNFDEALLLLNKALSLEPNYPEALYNLATILREKGELENAISIYQKALKFKPRMGEAHLNLGITFMELERLDDALNSYRNALYVGLKTIELFDSIGTAFREKGLVDDSINAIKKGLHLKPDSTKLIFNLSLSYLMNRKLVSGFECYESRFYLKKYKAIPPKKSMVWDGKASLKGKHFFVYEEQGLGDIIQFSRFLLNLKCKGATVTFKVTPKLHNLISSLDEDINLVSKFSEVKNVDFESSLLSLPHLLNTDINSIPFSEKYLSAIEQNVSYWAKKLDKTFFNIGIFWQGSNSQVDKGRSFPLSLFENISKISNVALISLQKGMGEEQLKHINFDVNHFSDELDKGDQAFFDTSAVIQNCDLVVTSDSSVAHLAGALGQATWLVLKKVPDWRWFLEQTHTPWYSNMKLYRQQHFDDWKPVFKRIENDIREQLMMKT